MPDLLNTSLSGLRAYQGALSTTAHNIANVGNEDYTRQRIELNARNPIQFGNSFFGQGTELTSISRIVDEFNTINIRDFTSNVGRLESFDFYARRVESIIADETAGLMPALDGFFNAVNDVANDPSANAPRVALLGATENLQQRMTSIANELHSIELEIDARLRAEVNEINSIVGEIAEINGVLTASTSVGNESSDLLDKRDALLKRLSEKITVTVVKQADGNINVLVGTGQLIVANSTALKLVTEQDLVQPDKTAIAVQSSGGKSSVTRNLVGGSLGGLLDLRENLLANTQNRLGRTAIGIADSVNALHVQGHDLNGNLGGNVFSTVPTGPLQGQFGGDFLGNGFVAGETISFDLTFDGQTISVSHLIQPGDTNQDIAEALLFNPASSATTTSINESLSVTDLGNGTYSLQAAAGRPELIFEMYGSNIKFQSSGGPSAISHNLEIDNLSDGTVPNNGTMSLLSLGSSSTQITSNVVSSTVAGVFVGPTSTSVPNLNNAGTGNVVYAISDASQLTISNYEVRFDGVDFNVFRLNDNALVASGTGPFTVDGIDIGVGGVPVAGDSYLIQPTKLGAVNMLTTINNTDEFAMALPVRSLKNAANIGNAQISAASVTDVTNGRLNQTVNIVFDPANPAGTFDVIDVATGTIIPGFDNVTYFNGINVNVNGWQVQLTGEPQPGDSFTIENNTTGVGDNRNALSLANLRIQAVLDGGKSTFEQSYNSLVSEVGVMTQQVKIRLDVEESLLNNAIAVRETVSGVNLDEEAADLIRYQQAYQALSRIVQASQELFESLINAV